MAVRMLILLLLVCALGGGCSRPRYMLTEEKYPETPQDQEIKLYVNEVQRPHVKIAIIQSKLDSKKDADTKRAQLEDLTEQARKLGADAVVDVRQMNNKMRGFVVDEAVPFRAYRQGSYKLYFLRGTAIKFVTEEEAAAAAAANPEQVLLGEVPAGSTEDSAIPEIDTPEPEEDSMMPFRTPGLGPRY